MFNCNIFRYGGRSMLVNKFILLWLICITTIYDCRLLIVYLIMITKFPANEKINPQDVQYLTNNTKNR